MEEKLDGGRGSWVADVVMVVVDMVEVAGDVVVVVVCGGGRLSL